MTEGHKVDEAYRAAALEHLKWVVAADEFGDLQEETDKTEEQKTEKFAKKYKKKLAERTRYLNDRLEMSRSEIEDVLTNGIFVDDEGNPVDTNDEEAFDIGRNSKKKILKSADGSRMIRARIKGCLEGIVNDSIVHDWPFDDAPTEDGGGGGTYESYSRYASYLLDKLGSFNLNPPTGMRMIRGQMCSVEARIEEGGAPQRRMAYARKVHPDEAEPQARYSFWKEEVPNEYGTIYESDLAAYEVHRVFHFISHNEDTHPGNFKELPFGKIILYDEDMAWVPYNYHADHGSRSSAWYPDPIAGTPLHYGPLLPETIAKIRSLSLVDVARVARQAYLPKQSALWALLRLRVIKEQPEILQLPEGWRSDNYEVDSQWKQRTDRLYTKVTKDERIRKEIEKALEEAGYYSDYSWGIRKGDTAKKVLKDLIAKGIEKQAFENNDCVFMLDFDVDDLRLKKFKLEGDCSSQPEKFVNAMKPGKIERILQMGGGDRDLTSYRITTDKLMLLIRGDAKRVMVGARIEPWISEMYPMLNADFLDQETAFTFWPVD
jgi:hypothetical protein